jgi:hypothetical protein
MPSKINIYNLWQTYYGYKEVHVVATPCPF